MVVDETVEKPRLRGVIHLIAFAASLITGPILIWTSKGAVVVATAVFTSAMSALFGISALYHRPDWRPKIRAWLRRLDHTMIFVFIAASFTPLAATIGTTWSRIVLVVAWSAVAVAAVLRLFPWRGIPKKVVIVPFIALGWFGLSLLPSMITHAGLTPSILVIAGGIAYTVGAIAYARHSPNPAPGWFGYHEVFHTFVVIGAYLHYTAVAIAIV